MTPRSAAIKEDIPLFKEFDDDPLDDSIGYHWRINRNQFDEATLIEQRVAMHRMLRKLIDTRSEPDHYPERVLESDWLKLQTSKFDRYLIDGSINCYPSSSCFSHFRILEHYFNPSVNLDNLALWYAIRKIRLKKTILFNSTSIRKMARWAERRRVMSPLIYCAIFKALNISGAVADLHPGYGLKAVACAMMGLPYLAVKSERLQRAIDLGLTSFLRMEFEWFNKQNVGLLISDNNFDGFSMPAKEKLSQACRMLCFVPRKDRQRLVDRLNPSAVLQIHSQSELSKTMQDPNYLFLW